MPRNGSGQYTLPAGNPVVTGTIISSSGWANPTLADVAAALSDSIAADGQTLPTANLPMGNFRHTQVANAQARTDYAAAGQVQDNAFTVLTGVGGTADAITANLVPGITNYATGAKFTFTAAAANTTTTPTLSIDGLAAKTLVHADASALAAGDIAAGATLDIFFDGTDFRILGMYAQTDEFARIVGPGGTITGDISMSGDIATSGDISTTGNITLSGSGSLIDPNAQWTAKAIGEPFALFDHLTGVSPPPTTNSQFRFVRLTASDSYNSGVLTGESVSGSAPTITATAAISLAGSPLNGMTIHLINTERRFLRAGSSGALQDSANLSHSHTAGADTQGSHSHAITDPGHGHTVRMDNLNSIGTFNAIAANHGISPTTGMNTDSTTTGIGIQNDGLHTHVITVNAAGDTESRPRNIGATYYMRIL